MGNPIWVAFFTVLILYIRAVYSRERLLCGAASLLVYRCLGARIWGCSFIEPSRPDRAVFLKISFCLLSHLNAEC